MSKQIMLTSLTVLLIIMTGGAGAFASDVNINPGKWEMTSEMKMPGMSMPPMTTTRCLTKEDLVPQSSDPNQECKISDVETSGDTVTWTMKCSGQGGDSTAKGEITYNGDTYEGTLLMNQEGMEITMKMNGRRIGECD